MNNEFRPPMGQEGIVLKGTGGFYILLTADGVLTCKLRGKLRQYEEGVLVGDRVEYSVISETEDANAVIEKILPRQNRLVRPKIANITGAILQVSALTPAPDWLLLDKMLVMSAYHGLEIRICVNKYDALEADEKEALKEQGRVYEQCGYDVFMLSAKKGLGVDALRSSLRGGIWVFAGASGVGKSSLFNSLMEAEKMEVGEISQRLGRGKHTTRHAEIMPLQHGKLLLADTPGFSLLELPEDLPENELKNYYPEFERNRGCRFDTCLHDREPDCLIKKMVSEGELDKGRYERYLKILGVLRERVVKY